ncbi:glycoside hydrolase family 88/105 protein [Mucilaginibacter sp. X5P1]|uniref:glycoside hydrolase family 88/105 protein n=1 Tax=Mucilaginibacter sp. X5P1 TaxID=2723088 RepID=UPI00161D75FF|nr:glycoside hydrolase family 88 protein [Mucilaginibacter sp. X5P1]MBB6138761.1 rhamnogalacturonyl hydrolase YesR [Mucilaginibacter sp. X5P1]
MNKLSAKRIFLLGAAIACSLTASAQKTDTLFKRANILKTMERVSAWQFNTWQTKGSQWPKYDWTNAAGYTGMLELGKLSKTDTSLSYLLHLGNSLNWQTGPRRFMADDYCIAQTYAILYKMYSDKEMITKFREQADSIIAQPHTESLEWKNNISQREWAWCDAMFMGPTSFSYLYTATHDQKYLDFAVKMWWKTYDYLYDPAEHLYFRDGSYLNKKEKNGQKVFWSRGNGWVMAGLVRVIDNMPANYPDRPKFIQLYKDMAARVAGLQQPDGSWHASLLDPASYPIKETSGTGFFTYSLLWGLNNGILDKQTYWPVVQKAWTALSAAVHPDGMLGYIQHVGAAPDKVDENSTEIYGVGAFLLTGTQLYKYVGHMK